MRAKTIVSAVIAAFGFATALAAPAFADGTDDTFINAIRGQGIPYSSEENAVSLAGAVCDYVAAGEAPEQVTVEIMGPAGWTAEQSRFFVGAATMSYCPS